MPTNNAKDIVTTVCGIAFAAASSILAVVASGVSLPTWLTAGATAVAGASGLVIGWLTGKNPNLKTKSDVQVADQNAQSK